MQAMILAAGRGERMRPLTDHTPKPLLTVGGKPLIVWQIERLVRAGFSHIVINYAHLGEQIAATLGDGSRLGARIEYSPEAEALETAGGIAQALSQLEHSPFLVVNGDIFTDFDFARLHPQLTQMEKTPNLLAHLVLVDNPPHHPQGDFALVNGKAMKTGESKLTFSGIGLYQTALFNKIKPGEKAKLSEVLQQPLLTGKVSGEYYPGNWLDVGTIDRLNQAEQLAAQTKTCL